MTLHRAGFLALAAVLLSSIAGCRAESSSPSDMLPTVAPTPVSRARQLLATLPADAGGLHFGSYQIVDNWLHVGHPVDQVLAELDKEREDAASVFRFAKNASVGAVAVDGIDGGALLEAFVEAWNASAIIRRWQRPAAGTIGWELQARLGTLTVVYLRGSTVYLVSTSDPARLRAILADMPPGGA
jgi:hypothetical protein